MFTIKKSNITLVRGDTLKAKLTITDLLGNVDSIENYEEH